MEYFAYPLYVVVHQFHAAYKIALPDPIAHLKYLCPMHQTHVEQTRLVEESVLLHHIPRFFDAATVLLEIAARL